MKTLPIAIATLLLSTGSALAGEQTVRLDVANATCELCGPIVKGSLARVQGVLDVKLTESDKATTATVRFDDGRTDVATLIAATTNAGYPSKVMQ
jgi:mercuric ion binding protein